MFYLQPIESENCRNTVSLWLSVVNCNRCCPEPWVFKPQIIHMVCLINSLNSLEYVFVIKDCEVKRKRRSWRTRKMLAVLGFCTGLVSFFFFFFDDNTHKASFLKRYLNMPINRLPLIHKKYDFCFVLKHKCNAIFKTCKLRALLLKMG